MLSEPREVRKTRLEEDLVIPFENPSGPIEESELVGSHNNVRHAQICERNYFFFKCETRVKDGRF